jgi:hypothetical protein
MKTSRLSLFLWLLAFVVLFLAGLLEGFSARPVPYSPAPAGWPICEHSERDLVINRN